MLEVDSLTLLLYSGVLICVVGQEELARSVYELSATGDVALIYVGALLSISKEEHHDMATCSIHLHPKKRMCELIKNGLPLDTGCKLEELKVFAEDVLKFCEREVDLSQI
jgi:hypothetical protein